jgi:hypothetical protein
MNNGIFTQSQNYENHKITGLFEALKQLGAIYYMYNNPIKQNPLDVPINALRDELKALGKDIDFNKMELIDLETFGLDL